LEQDKFMPIQYQEVIITCADTSKQEVIIALLSEQEYDSFLQEDTQLKAYIESTKYDEAVLQELLPNFEATYTSAPLPDKNWNDEWEKNYEPVIVNDKVAVRATFHPPITSSACNIIITPKMSFGTGHHSTTHLMLAQMSDMNFTNKTVLDYGCGTGVLGIYASMQGATHVCLCDIDDWCVENTLENIGLNKASHCEVLKCNISETPSTTYDVICANINLNILVDNMDQMIQRLSDGGHILFSGFYESDAQILEHYGKKAGLQLINRHNMLTWCCLHMSK
jgi:ribosomal protein L11 methyltransferase